MQPSIIPDKQSFYSLFNQGAFGNKTANWTVEGYSQSTYTGNTMVRLKIPNSPLCKAELSRDSTNKYIRTLVVQHNIAPTNIVISELAPDHLITLQGEAYRMDNYLYLRYNTIPNMRMRDAMRQAASLEGLEALNMIKHHMDANSYDWFQELLDRYPDSVVEFSCYSCHTGELGWNTLFWEVRNY